MDCVDYKHLSKVLANGLKNFLNLVVHRDQSSCVPDRSIKDNLFSMRDLLDICKLYSIDVGVFCLDQEKMFYRVDDGFLFSTFWFWGCFCHFWVCCTRMFVVGEGLCFPARIPQSLPLILLYLIYGTMNVSMFSPPWLSAQLWDSGSLRTSVSLDFESVGKKDLYLLAIKDTNLQSLAGLKASRWTVFFGMQSFPGGLLTVPVQTSC